MLAVLPSEDRLIVLTIPDFSVTPAGKRFGDPRKNSEGVARFNTIVQEEAKSRGLTVIDLFAVSQEMGRDRSLVAPDGLHPSGKEYAAWEELIFSKIRNVVVGGGDEK
jgi:lysophospholipase L1-like esterase